MELKQDQALALQKPDMSASLLSKDHLGLVQPLAERLKLRQLLDDLHLRSSLPSLERTLEPPGGARTILGGAQEARRVDPSRPSNGLYYIN